MTRASIYRCRTTLQRWTVSGGSSNRCCGGRSRLLLSRPPALLGPPSVACLAD